MSRWPISTAFATLNHGAAGDALVAVALGTPHFSLAEFRTLDTLLDAFDGKPACDFYVNTSRFILWGTGGGRPRGKKFAARGIQIVVDTCTYITPVMKRLSKP